MDEEGVIIRTEDTYSSSHNICAIISDGVGSSHVLIPKEQKKLKGPHKRDGPLELSASLHPFPVVCLYVP